MLHWALVNNMLTAVGSAPYVARPHMPHQAKGYPAGVQLALVPFGERALRHFLFLERPEGMELEDADGFDPSGPALPIMAPTDIVPWGQEFHTVGHLYRSIQAGIRNLADKLGEPQLFIGPRGGAGDARVVRMAAAGRRSPTSATASSAIDAIVEQGEGARGDWSRRSLRPLPRRARGAAGDQGRRTRRSSRLTRWSAPACGRSTGCTPTS